MDANIALTFETRPLAGTKRVLLPSSFGSYSVIAFEEAILLAFLLFGRPSPSRVTSLRATARRMSAANDVWSLVFLSREIDWRNAAVFGRCIAIMNI